MIFNADRLQVLSGIKNNSSGGNLLNESSTRSRNQLVEQKIRQIIREEIKSYLNERQSKAASVGFKKNNLTAAMGFAGPGFQPRNEPNRSVSRGPGGTLGFGGPGFM
tara:strand:+ start:2908 stop:3228 length:321 start_codon:yes stop_codon:yes gene_type:complete